jgi:hypothetical protein
MDPVGMVVGVAILVGGWLAGRLSRRQKVGREPTLLCSCGYGYGAHENQGKCQAQIERPHYRASGHRVGYEWVWCPCLAYDGPEPLPRVWSDQ